MTAAAQERPVRPYAVVLASYHADLLWALMDFPVNRPEFTCVLNVRAAGTPAVTFEPARYASWRTLTQFGPRCISSSYLHVDGRVLPSSAYRDALLRIQDDPGAPVPAVVQATQRAMLSEPAFTALRQKLKDVRSALRRIDGAAQFVDVNGNAQFVWECPPPLDAHVSREVEAHVGAPLTARHFVTLAGPSDRQTRLSIRAASGTLLYHKSTVQARQDLPRLLTAMQNRARHGAQRGLHTALKNAALITVLPLFPSSVWSDHASVP